MEVFYILEHILCINIFCVLNHKRHTTGWELDVLNQHPR